MTCRNAPRVQCDDQGAKVSWRHDIMPGPGGGGRGYITESHLGPDTQREGKDDGEKVINDRVAPLTPKHPMGYN